jgi:hypothetical protein
MSDHLESKAGVEFQREQQQKENDFRNREILLKETELDLKREESHRSRWSSPLVVAIAVAAAGVFGNAAVTWWTSREQEKLERERAEAARILEVIKTNDADKAANNLAFLLDAGLISDSNTRKSLSTFLQARPPGKGPSLPSLVPTATIEVDPQFKQIQETVPQLGKPRLPAVLADDAYQAVYDQANIIWIKSLFSILTLPTDAARKVTWQEDTNYSKDLKFFNDDWLKTQFADVPDGKYPPHGGVAYYWLQNPDQWKWVGWRKWYCRFFNQIRYQQFENGTVVGIFHSDPAKDAGQIFIVLNDNSWLTKPAPSVAPSCIADPVGPHAEP